MRVLITEHADADTAVILRYLAANATFAVAERYARDLDWFYDDPESLPGLGVPHPELGPETRICRIAPYFVVYDLHPEEVIVLRVLHGRRNITRDLLRLHSGRPSGTALTR